MKRFFTIIVAALVLAGWFSLSSCDRPKPPDYDESRNQAISQICRFLREEQFDQAIALLKKTDALEHQLLFEVLSEHEQERLLLAEANELLKTGRYQELSSLIEQAEKNGVASPDLLEYRSAPQALQALQVFCSRMPWETSEDLENAMKWLQPYLPTLQQAPAFKEFWQQQLEQRKKLHKNQIVRQQQELLENIDQLIGNDQRHAAWNVIEKIWQMNPAQQIFALLEPKQRKLKENFLELWREHSLPPELYELSLALTWPDLPSQRRQQLKPFLTQTSTLAGSILAAELFESPEFYAVAIRRWNAIPENQARFPLFLEKALAKVFFQPDQFNARCWRTPCPNLTDFFARVNQIAVNIKQSQD